MQSVPVHQTQFDPRRSELLAEGRTVAATQNWPPEDPFLAFLPAEPCEITALEDVGLMTNLETGDLEWEPCTPMHRRREVIAIFARAVALKGSAQ